MIEKSIQTEHSNLFSVIDRLLNAKYYKFITNNKLKKCFISCLNRKLLHSEMAFRNLKITPWQKHPCLIIIFGDQIPYTCKFENEFEIAMLL